MRKIPIFASCLTLLAAMPLTAHAAEKIAPDAFAKRLFAAVSLGEKQQACFVRRYDAAHLARHPKQTVTVMRLLVSAEKEEGDTEFGYGLKFGVNLRDRAGDFVGSQSCGHVGVATVQEGGTAIRCEEGCGDGAGGVAVALGSRDKSVVVTIDRLSLWRPDRPDDENASATLRAQEGGDDSVFRLDRADMSECAGLGEDDQAATLTQ